MIRIAESWSVEALYLLCFIYTDFQNMPGVAFFFFFFKDIVGLLWTTGVLHCCFAINATHLGPQLMQFW